MSFELVILTPNGAIVGTFDSADEANNLYKFAKANGYDIVTRKIDDYSGSRIIAERRFVENENIFRSGLQSSVDALRGTLHRMTMEYIG